MVSFNIHSEENTLEVSIEDDSGKSCHRVEIDPISTTRHPDFDLIRDRCIRAGGPPSDDELSAIKASRDSLDQDRHRYLAQVRELEASLITAIHSLRQTEIQIGICDSLPAPIRRLPPETLCEIFGWCFRMSEGDEINKVPFYISRVCRYWSDIISSNNSAWSRLRIDSPRDQATTPEYLEKIKQRISLFRSGSRGAAPLSLACFIGGFGSPSWGIFTLLLPHLSECKRLYLATDKFERGQQMTYVTGQPSPVLSNLEYIYFNFTNIYPSDIWPNLLRHVPKLKEIEMVVWASEHFKLLRCRPEEIGQQLKKLSTTVRIGGRRSQRPSPILSWRNVLQAYPNLHTLEINIKNYTQRRFELPHPNLHHSAVSESDVSNCTLPDLQNFTLKSDFGGCLMSFLHGFNLPSLSYLSLDVVHPFRLVYQGQSLRRCLTNELFFFSHLMGLHLIRVCLSEDDLRAILETTTRLEKLTIMNLDPSSQWYTYGHCVINNDPIVSLLSVNYPDTALPLVPRLTELHLFHTLKLNSEPDRWAEQYAALFDTRTTWRRQQSMEPKFSIRVSVSSYRKKGYNTKEECEAPETELEIFKADVRERVASYKGSCGAGSLVVVERAREPFQKRYKFYNTNHPSRHSVKGTGWYDSIDPRYPAPLCI